MTALPRRKPVSHIRSTPVLLPRWRVVELVRGMTIFGEQTEFRAATYESARDAMGRVVPPEWHLVCAVQPWHGEGVE